MAKARSPGYPSIGLKEAIERIGAVWKKDYQNKIPRPVVASHMGYSGLSGKSLGVLSSLGKFGLLEGRGDENWVSDLAVAILAHPSKAPERVEAIKASASMPDLFSDIDSRFQNGKASDQAIKSWLIMQKFIPAAADAAIRSYRETKELVEEESEGYIGREPGVSAKGGDVSPRAPAEVGDLVQVEIGGAFQLKKPARLREMRDYEGRKWAFIDGSETGIPMEQIVLQSKGSPEGPAAPVLQEVRKPLQAGLKEEKNALDEGEAILILPETLTPESVRDLEYWLQGIVRKAKRRANMLAVLTPEVKTKLIAAGVKPEKLENLTPEEVGALGALAEE